MSLSSGDENPDHLRNKIEIIFNYNSEYIPEFSSLHGDEDIVELRRIYQLALSRVTKENYIQHKKILETILPLFDVVESRLDQPGTAIISNFILMSVQGTIKGHLETLSYLERRTIVEERCLVLCQKIISLGHDETIKFFPLFKEYLILLIDHQDKITAPLSFEDPTKLVNSVYQESNIPLMILGGPTCLLL